MSCSTGSRISTRTGRPRPQIDESAPGTRGDRRRPRARHRPRGRGWTGRSAQVRHPCAGSAARLGSSPDVSPLGPRPGLRSAPPRRPRAACRAAGDLLLQPPELGRSIRPHGDPAVRPRLVFFGPKEEDMAVGGRNRLMAWTGATIPYRPGKDGSARGDPPRPCRDRRRRRRRDRRRGPDPAERDAALGHSTRGLPTSPSAKASRSFPIAIGGTSWLGLRAARPGA